MHTRINTMVYPEQISLLITYQRFSPWPFTRFKPLATLNMPRPADHRAVTAVTEIMVAGDFKDRSLTTRKARDL